MTTFGLSFALELEKLATIVTPLQPHQQRVVDRIKRQPGLVVAHGLGSGKNPDVHRRAGSSRRPT